MYGLLVQSPDTHGRVVATLVCLQHFGSHSRFAHAHLIFWGEYNWASYCSFIVADLLRGIQFAVRWPPLPEHDVGRTALVTMTFPMLLRMLLARPLLLSMARLFFDFRHRFLGRCFAQGH